MKTDIAQPTAPTKYLKDYAPTPYKRDRIELNFDIRGKSEVIVTSKQYFERREGTPSGAPLVLDGEHHRNVTAKIDGKDVKAEITDKTLTIASVPDKFELEITSTISPEANTRLEGLYSSGDMLCTQCEAEGFRSIAYTYDRPDCLGVFTVRIEADKAEYPVLLSNGNNTENGDLPNGRHFAVWHDPFPKPGYLFALVAGKLEYIEDFHTTQEKRKVKLRIYVRKGDEKRAEFAIRSLIKSMDWDERAYGRNYDLDIFNIVAVSDFNFGAMENKSLNIFNARLVLADLETATDADFVNIEAVVGHEYFHNWTGDRITCRDWFQITLKEGLTTLREQQFAEESNGESLQRINDVNFLRQHQFAEDAGPMAHPIRPDHYIEINNFYTTTVYEKGAEVIRMMRTLIGADAYRKGTDLFFERHDGQAVTCEDFVKCLEDGSGKDLSLFWRWYTQAGTPHVTATGHWNEAAQTFTVTLEQRTPPTHGQPHKDPLPMPIVVGLVGPNGHDLAEKTLFLTQEKESFVFEGIAAKPVPSINRNFSAPVILKTDLTPADLRFLMVQDKDGFNRWEAGQSLAMIEIQKLLKDPQAKVDETYLDAWADMLGKDDDAGLKAVFLDLPSIKTIAQTMEIIDPHAARDARNALMSALNAHCKDNLIKQYENVFRPIKGQDPLSNEAQGRRALKNILLDMLTANMDEVVEILAERQYDEALTMTERAGAIAAISDHEGQLFEEMMQDFYKRFENHELALNKWFGMHVTAVRSTTLDKVTELTQMPLFNWKNPNRVRAVFGGFSDGNPTVFHDPSGRGYKLLADAIVKLNETNPMVAGRLFTPFRQYKRFRSDLRDKMEAEIKRIAATPNLAADLQEVLGRTLG